MDWAQRIFYAVGLSYFSSSHDGLPNDGMTSCPLDAGPSEYCYDGGPYDNESGLADHFYNVVHAADQPLWNGCTQSQLATIAGHTLPGDYYNTNKLIKNLGLPVEKIGACKNGCMLYWKDDVDLEYCKSFGDPRYKPTRGQDTHRKKSPYVVLRYLPLTPHLQRLHSSRATDEHMTWHATHQMEEGSMCHPSDAEAWKHCRRAPGVDMDCEQLTRVWDGGWSIAGVMECPVCMDDTRAFHLQHGRKACYFDYHRQFFPEHHPYRRNKKAFMKNRVENKRPQVDEEKHLLDLPYWSMLQIRHNLNVMHIEKNIFDNIFNTVMDIKEKTKDNLNTRMDLKSICNRPKLELDERRPNIMPKAAYTLTKEQKRRVCEWIKGLKFPDG
ncbi:UNVERIFIED_CONTAM: hypothetical protein Slati_2772400 [Sesamum latifolium]|uniref:Uncharacterized protein n=1 Tax=Sesamum latifolium TaxID=2727402 RepID=A0AAW2W2J5_9LAMI